MTGKTTEGAAWGRTKKTGGVWQNTAKIRLNLFWQTAGFFALWGLS